MPQALGVSLSQPGPGTFPQGHPPRALCENAVPLRSKRGGGAEHVPLEDALLVSQRKDVDLVALDDVLTALSAIDPRKSQVVELRYFGGLSVAETAEVLKVSPDTILRDWKLAKAWLLREIKKGNDKGQVASEKWITQFYLQP